MTNHPLTDEICDQIQDSIHPCDPENMRSAADWQLEQALEWLKDGDFEHGVCYHCKYRSRHLVVNAFKEAMRPTTQEDA
jgi:hypothetical protein